MKVAGMLRERRGLRIGLACLGMLLSVSAVESDEARKTEFRLACGPSAKVDPAAAATICAELAAVVKERTGQDLLPEQTSPLATGPGLEITVDLVTGTGLQLTPTWVDADGHRVTQSPVGLRVADAELSAAMRRGLYLRLLANLPQ